LPPRGAVREGVCHHGHLLLQPGQHLHRPTHASPRNRGLQEALSAAQWRQTFPALLREAGYRTAFLGKFAIGAPGTPAVSRCRLTNSTSGMASRKASPSSRPLRARRATDDGDDREGSWLPQGDEAGPAVLLIVALKNRTAAELLRPGIQDPIAGATIPQPSNLTRQSFDALPEVVRRGLNAVPEWLQKPEAFQTELQSEYALISRSDLAVGQICQALESKDSMTTPWSFTCPTTARSMARMRWKANGSCMRNPSVCR